MKQKESVLEKLLRKAESGHEDNEEYTRDMLTVMLISWKEQKAKDKRERQLMEDAIKTLNNDIARCDYHIGMVKQIMIEKGWTLIDNKKR